MSGDEADTGAIAILSVVGVAPRSGPPRRGWYSHRPFHVSSAGGTGKPPVGSLGVPRLPWPHRWRTGAAGVCAPPHLMSGVQSGELGSVAQVVNFAGQSIVALRCPVPEPRWEIEPSWTPRFSLTRRQLQSGVLRHAGTDRAHKFSGRLENERTMNPAHRTVTALWKVMGVSHTGCPPWMPVIERVANISIISSATRPDYIICLPTRG